MDFSAERDYSAQRYNEEGGPLGNRDVPIGASLWTTTALDHQHQATMADLPENVSATARQREDHLPFGAAAWKLGHDLIDEQEYGRAAECFRRVLLSVGTSANQLSIEAAEVAVQLCAALSQERSVGEKLQDIRRILGQNLSELSYEEVSFVRDTLATCERAQAQATHYGSSTLAAREPTGATAGRALPPAGAPTPPGSWDLASNRSEAVAVASRSCLRVHFFGRFELLRDGEEVVCLGRNGRALAILKYLLAHRKDRPVPQDYLMGWLWPESDPKRARWSLNSAIYVLRKLLGGCVRSLPTSEIVLFDGGGYRLSPRVLLDLDTDEFDVHYEEGRRLEEASRVPEAVAEYEKAAELYRGDYLIEDLYEDWTMIERERLVDAYTDLSRRLAVRYMEGGRLREGVRTCYRILEKYRCDEDTHRLLMECYVRLGQRARALRQYRLCEQVLRHECDMMPSPETRALYASILKGGRRR
jgi:DNA-binding SARP family transcriptional activator